MAGYITWTNGAQTHFITEQTAEEFVAYEQGRGHFVDTTLDGVSTPWQVQSTSETDPALGVQQ